MYYVYYYDSWQTNTYIDTYLNKYIYNISQVNKRHHYNS